MGSGTRRITAFLLAFVIAVVAGASTASAAPYSEKTKDNGSGGLLGALSNPISWIINGLANLISEALERIGLDSVESLVFNDGRAVPATVGDAFTSSEWNGVVMPWFRVFSSLVMVPVVIGVIVTMMGMRLATNPRAIGEASEMVLNVLIAVTILLAAPDILKFFLMVNDAIVGVIKGNLVSRNLYVPGTAAAIRQAVLQEFGDGNVLSALVNLNLVALTLYFNVIYLVRKVVLALMLITLPLVVWTWTSRRARVPILTVFSEMLTNSFMSASHAILFGFFLAMLGIEGAGALSTWWAKLIVLNLIIPLSALLRKIMIGWMNFLGADEERMATAGLMGLAGIASLAKIAGTVVTSTPRAITSTYSGVTSSIRTRATLAEGARKLEEGQHMIEGQVMAFGKTTARIVNADRQGFDVPLDMLPKSTAIGDRFVVTLGPEDPNRETPEIIKVQPAPRSRPVGAGGVGGARSIGTDHNIGRAVGSFNKLVTGVATFNTPVQKPATEVAGSIGYSSAASAARWLPAAYRWAASHFKDDGGGDGDERK